MELTVFKDQPAMVDEAVELCNQHMEYDTISLTLFREKVFDDPAYQPDLVWAAYQDGRMVGFISGVTREIRGQKLAYIKLMVVQKEYRRKKIGTHLYQKLERAFQKMGMEAIRIYDVPFNYFMPGIDPRYTPAIAFFETLGFERFADTSNMIVDLNQNFDTSSQEEALKNQGIEIRRADYSDQTAIMDFISQHFPLWQSEVANTFNSLPISLHIALYNGQIKAFSAHNGNNFGTGWFGPMGTHPDLRGKGIGGILLKRCLQDMKDWGLTQSIIPWVGPIRFYSYHVNARVERVFWRYEKKLVK